MTSSYPDLLYGPSEEYPYPHGLPELSRRYTDSWRTDSKVVPFVSSLQTDSDATIANPEQGSADSVRDVQGVNVIEERPEENNQPEGNVQIEKKRQTGEFNCFCPYHKTDCSLAKPDIFWDGISWRQGPARLSSAQLSKRLRNGNRLVPASRMRFDKHVIMKKRPHTKVLFQKLEEVLKNHFSEQKDEDDLVEVFLNCSSWNETQVSNVLKTEEEVSFDFKLEIKVNCDDF